MTKLELENLGDENDFFHEATADSFDKAAQILLAEVILHYDIVPPDLYTALADLAMSEQDAEHKRQDFSTPEENFVLRRIKVTKAAEDFGPPHAPNGDPDGPMPSEDERHESDGGWTEEDYIEHLTDRMLEREAFGD